MAVPTITDLPTPPSRRRPQTFSNEADAWNAAFPQWTDETNALGEYVEQRAVDADNRATDSENARDASQEAQGLSEDARDLSLQYRNESEGFKNQSEIAAAAAGASAGLPTLAGNALKKLGVKAGEDGVEWQEIEESVALYQEFTTSGTFTKDPNAEFIYVEVIGGGGSGSANVNTEYAGGGGGGGFNSRLMRASEVGSTESVIVGSGGDSVSRTSSRGSGRDGGNSLFGAHLTGRGGKRGSSSNSSIAIVGGSGGGGEGGSSGIPASSPTAHGGFSSGGGRSSSVLDSLDGSSVAGGAGGGGARGSESTSGSTSLRGGDGGHGAGQSNGNATAGNGEFPGGGGGAASVFINDGNTYTATSGAGGDGVVRIWQW